MSPKLLFTPRVLWFALLWSNLLLAGILVFQMKPVPPGSWDWARAFPADIAMQDVGGMVWLMAFAAGAASVFVPPLLARGRPAPTNTQQLLALAFTPFILGLALAESATLLGFVSVFSMGLPTERIVVPLIIGVAATVRLFPTEARFRRLVGAAAR